jgi:hypothetical protein
MLFFKLEYRPLSKGTRSPRRLCSLPGKERCSPGIEIPMIISAGFRDVEKQS